MFVYLTLLVAEVVKTFELPEEAKLLGVFRYVGIHEKTFTEGRKGRKEKLQ